MKLLQIHIFSDQYLGGFYSNRPGLEESPFDVQIEQLLEDGFSGAHLFPPYLNTLGYDSHMVIANCVGAQLSWAKDHELRSLTPENWIIQIASILQMQFGPK